MKEIKLKKLLKKAAEVRDLTEVERKEISLEDINLKIALSCENNIDSLLIDRQRIIEEIHSLKGELPAEPETPEVSETTETPEETPDEEPKTTETPEETLEVPETNETPETPEEGQQ